MRSVPQLVLLAVALMLPAPLAAQSIPSPFDYIETSHSITLFGGYLLPQSDRLDLGPSSAPLFGLRYGLQFSGPLLGELSVSVAPSNRTIYAATSNAENPPLIEVGETDVLATIAEAGLRFRFTGQRTWHGIAPYAVATAGLAGDFSQSSPIDVALDEDQRYEFGPAFAVSAGLGNELFLSDWLSIRLDARDHFWRINFPIGLTNTAERENQWRHNFAFTIGSAIHF